MKYLGTPFPASPQQLLSDIAWVLEFKVFSSGRESATMDSRIGRFYRQYLQQVEVDKLSFPPNNVLIDPMIQFQLNQFLFNCHLMFPSETGTGLYLPLPKYQKRVAKELTRRLEGAIRNPDEDVG